MARNRSRPPIINAPPVITGLAVSLIALHAARVFSSDSINYEIQKNFALLPQRFWGWAGVDPSISGGDPYSGPLAALITLFTTALLHGDFMHVMLNATMLVAVGKPVYEDLSYARPGTRGRATELFFYMFAFSVMGGSLAHLLSNFPTGIGAVGASGGISGLIAAVLLRQPGANGRLLSGAFLKMTGAFVAANLALALVGPALLGSGIAWQAHIGGYIAGALFYRLILLRRDRARAETFDS